MEKMSDTQTIQMLIRGKADLEWFDRDLPNLLSKYNDQFIAFKNKSVVESDTSLDKLMEKLKQKKVDVSDLVIKFVSKIKYVL